MAMTDTPTASVASESQPARKAPSPKVERIFLICWVLIAIKHIAVIWAVHHYAVPFHQLWVNAPTWMLGVLATVVFYGRR